MEQRIEIFAGSGWDDIPDRSQQAMAGNAFQKAARLSATLAAEGWLVHQMTTQHFQLKSKLEPQVIVVYRRDNDQTVTPYESPSTHEAQPALRIVVCPHCDKQIRVTHESNVLVNCPLCNQQFKTP